MGRRRMGGRSRRSSVGQRSQPFASGHHACVACSLRCSPAALLRWPCLRGSGRRVLARSARVWPKPAGTVNEKHAKNTRRQRGNAEPRGGELPQMPRSVKYAWGVALTLLVALSLVLDRGSAWMPLVHRAIDLLQTQTAPTESR